MSKRKADGAPGADPDVDMAERASAVRRRELAARRAVTSAFFADVSRSSGAAVDAASVVAAGTPEGKAAMRREGRPARPGEYPSLELHAAYRDSCLAGTADLRRGGAQGPWLAALRAHGVGASLNRLLRDVRREEDAARGVAAARCMPLLPPELRARVTGFAGGCTHAEAEAEVLALIRSDPNAARDALMTFAARACAGAAAARRAKPAAAAAAVAAADAPAAPAPGAAPALADAPAALAPAAAAPAPGAAAPAPAPGAAPSRRLPVWLGDRPRGGGAGAAGRGRPPRVVEVLLGEGVGLRVVLPAHCPFFALEGEVRGHPSFAALGPDPRRVLTDAAGRPLSDVAADHPGYPVHAGATRLVLAPFDFPAAPRTLDLRVFRVACTHRGGRWRTRGTRAAELAGATPEEAAAAVAAVAARGVTRGVYLRAAGAAGACVAASDARSPSLARRAADWLASPPVRYALGPTRKRRGTATAELTEVIDCAEACGACAARLERGSPGIRRWRLAALAASGRAIDVDAEAGGDGGGGGADDDDVPPGHALYYESALGPAVRCPHP
ncbi:hypothetical protein JKP88DRAFT_279214 [Tribonema minus]|uniref:Uncharacterized protein n=1 Tax=Tribonema minus TaxID=303371 RepID=A0A835YTM2_9STRA|nr:hypothetical protein JKP88DRAFT_279214 [Tribonema minus]